MQSFKIKFDEIDKDPCKMSLSILEEIYKKSTDPRWSFGWLGDRNAHI